MPKPRLGAPEGRGSLNGGGNGRRRGQRTPTTAKGKGGTRDGWGWGGSLPYQRSRRVGFYLSAAVSTYAASGYGFYDMTGNVWEWMRGGKHKDRIVK